VVVGTRSAPGCPDRWTRLPGSRHPVCTELLLALFNCPVETGQRPLEYPTANCRGHQGILSSCFSKDRPFVAPEPPSPLPGEDRVACATPPSSFASQQLRLLVVPTVWFHATPPVFSSSILSALLQRLTTLGFIVVSPVELP